MYNKLEQTLTEARATERYVQPSRRVSGIEPTTGTYVLARTKAWALSALKKIEGNKITHINHLRYGNPGLEGHCTGRVESQRSKTTFTTFASFEFADNLVGTPILRQDGKEKSAFCCCQRLLSAGVLG